MCIKQMSIRTVRIKFYGSFELIFGCVPIPIVPKYREAEFGMSLGESVINFDGLLSCRFRFREKFGCRHFAYKPKRTICVGESSVREPVRRVSFNRLLEIRNAGLNFRRCIFGKMVTSLELKLIGFPVFALGLRQLLLIPSRPLHPH